MGLLSLEELQRQQNALPPAPKDQPWYSGIGQSLASIPRGIADYYRQGGIGGVYGGMAGDVARDVSKVLPGAVSYTPTPAGITQNLAGQYWNAFSGTPAPTTSATKPPTQAEISKVPADQTVRPVPQVPWANIPTITAGGQNPFLRTVTPQGTTYNTGYGTATFQGQPAATPGGLSVIPSGGVGAINNQIAALQALRGGGGQPIQGGGFNPQAEYAQNRLNSEMEKIFNSVGWRSGPGFGAATMYPEHYRRRGGAPEGDEFSGQMQKLAALQQMYGPMAQQWQQTQMTPAEQSKLAALQQEYGLQREKLAAEQPLQQAQAAYYGAQAGHQAAQAQAAQQLAQLQQQYMMATDPAVKKKLEDALYAVQGKTKGGALKYLQTGSVTDLEGNKSPGPIFAGDEQGNYQFINPQGQAGGVVSFGGQPQAQAQANIPLVQTEEDIAKVPSGGLFRDKDNNVRRKP